MFTTDVNLGLELVNLRFLIGILDSSIEVIDSQRIKELYTDLKDAINTIGKYFFDLYINALMPCILKNDIEPLAMYKNSFVFGIDNMYPILDKEIYIQYYEEEDIEDLNLREFTKEEAKSFVFHVNGLETFCPDFLKRINESPREIVLVIKESVLKIDFDTIFDYMRSNLTDVFDECDEYVEKAEKKLDIILEMCRKL